jgi:hypothetical protein
VARGVARSSGGWSTFYRAGTARGERTRRSLVGVEWSPLMVMVLRRGGDEAVDL